ncbi:MAG TPA: DUF3047 domain-containing protein [Methylomirabilota bacterium]|jgi:hypothetical protein|nr:DUF3047 domain-containing protein [Methylomirabilota bacterium]
MRRWLPAALLIALSAGAGLLATRAPSGAAPADCITLGDFSKAKIGEFPADWKAREEAGKEVYSVQQEGGVTFLRAVSKGLGIQAAREVDGWDLGAYPMLAWSWRPRQFPKGSDERDSKLNDSALAVYMLVPHSRVRGPKAVKYIWSEKVPVGTPLSSNHGLTQVRVLRSGAPAGKDAWVEERVNVLADYKKLFKESKTPKPAGIAVLTDADDTGSVAAGDYAKFRACRG